MMMQIRKLALAGDWSKRLNMVRLLLTAHPAVQLTVCVHTLAGSGFSVIIEAS
jgi:hypothetical protein